MTVQELIERLGRGDQDKKVIIYNRTDNGLKEMELYYTAERGPYLNVVLEVLEEKN